MELRWLNDKLQQFDGQQWVDVPIVVNPSTLSQCPSCGAFHTGDHVCWVAEVRG